RAEDEIGDAHLVQVRITGERLQTVLLSLPAKLAHRHPATQWIQDDGDCACRLGHQHPLHGRDGAKLTVRNMVEISQSEYGKTSSLRGHRCFVGNELSVKSIAGAFGVPGNALHFANAVVLAQ